MFNILFPFGIILYLYVAENVNFFMDMDMLQIMILSVYTLVFCLWIASFLWVIYEEYFVSFILPSSWDRLPEVVGWETNEDIKLMDVIKEKYARIVSYPWIQECLNDMFGVDVANTIFDYLENIEVNDKDILIEALVFAKFGAEIGDVILMFFGSVKDKFESDIYYGLL